MNYQIVGSKVFNDRDQEFLVQVGRHVFKLKYFKNVNDGGELKALLDDKRYDLRLLQERVE